VTTAQARINLSAPWIDERDEELVLEVLRSGWLSLGPTGPRFESLLADAVGAPYAAAVSSGTAGLHLCMHLVGVESGDEVITSPYSFVASANCAIYMGATPVFADIDPRTYNLDPDAVEAAITPRTKAIVAVDIFGYPAEYDELLALCEKHGIAMVEDSCEALGARYKGRPLGSHGHPAVWAFYPNKQMTTGEGGAVTTGSEEQHERLVSLRNQGRLETSSWLQHGRLGFNYRLDDLSAALGIGQLEKLDQILAARRGVRVRRAAARRGRRDAAARRRGPRALVVRLRRQASRRGRPGRGDGAARGAGHRDGAVPPVDPPAELHARALRVRRGDAAGERGLQRAHHGAAVPRPPRPRRPGAGRRGAARGARVEPVPGTEGARHLPYHDD
jgi:dTDP-4-amino-4,6-dideoxygalactose transaminase